MNKHAHISPKSLKPPSLALKDKQSPHTTNIPIKTIQYIHVYNYVKEDNPRIVFKKVFFWTVLHTNKNETRRKTEDKVKKKINWLRGESVVCLWRTQLKGMFREGYTSNDLNEGTKNWTKILLQVLSQYYVFSIWSKQIYLSCCQGEWFPLNFQVVRNDVLILTSGCNFGVFSFKNITKD